MFFDEEAKKWDTDFKIHLAKIASDNIKTFIDNKQFNKAMEFGCGTDLIGINLVDYFKTMTLIDNSDGMIEVLKRKLQINNLKNVDCKNLNILEDNTPLGPFDFIFSSLSLHHVIDTEAILNRFYDLLETGGAICIVELVAEDGSFHRHIPNYEGHNGFDPDDFKNSFEAAGFKNVETKEIYSGVRFVVDKDVDFKLFILFANK